MVVATSNGGKVLNMSAPVSNSAWIIDFDATNHMTFDSRQVSTFKPSSQKFVSSANGTSVLIIGEGFLSLTDTLNLDSVSFSVSVVPIVPFFYFKFFHFFSFQLETPSL